MASTRNDTRRRTRRGTAAGTSKRRLASTRGSAARKARLPAFKRFLQVLAVVGVSLFLLTIVMVLPWRWLAPPTSAFMLGERLAGDTAVDYRWIAWDGISPHLAMAVVAAEDQKFPIHHGFDFASIADALEQNAGRRRGASTISQQVAKNLFLWPGRSYIRKGIEAYCTVLIEILWPKRRILEIYLNVAEFGPGIFGAEAASRRFFDKPARDLTPWEASLLAAVLPNPKKMSAGRPSAYVRGRASEIRAWVRKLGGRNYLKAI